MTVYAVIPLSGQEHDLRPTIGTIDGGAYLNYEPTVYFVRFSGTSRRLAEILGFSGQPELALGDEAKTKPSSGVVVGVKDYYGFANQDLWNWLGESN